MPGYERSKIIGLTDQELDEFICGICLGLFADPVVTQCCRQTYCKDCIMEWVSLHRNCPNDRKTLTKKGLKPVPRVLVNLIDNMKIKCNFESEGCSQVVRIGELSNHLTVCDFRPNQLCRICGLIKESVLTHNCIQSLISEKQKTDEKYLQLLDENSSLLLFGREKDELIGSLRSKFAQSITVHQMALEGLKSNHAKTLNDFMLSNERAQNEFRNSFSAEMERKLSDEKSSYLLVLKEKDETIDSLRNELAQSKLDYKMAVESLQSDQARTLSQLEMNYESSSEEITALSEIERDRLKVTSNKQEQSIIEINKNLSEETKNLLKEGEPNGQIEELGTGQKRTGQMRTGTKIFLVICFTLLLVCIICSGVFLIFGKVKDNYIGSLLNDLDQLKIENQRAMDQLKAEQNRTLKELKLSYEGKYETLRNELDQSRIDNQKAMERLKSEYRDSYASEMARVKVVHNKQEQLISELTRNLSDVTQKLTWTQQNSNPELKQEVKSDWNHSNKSLGMGVKALVIWVIIFAYFQHIMGFY